MTKIPFVQPFPGPSSGTIAEGVLTMDRPVPEGMPECYFYLPANAVSEGSEAGWYRIEMLTPTTGKVCERYAP